MGNSPADVCCRRLMATVAAGQTAGPADLAPSPKDPCRQGKQGRVLGGQEEGTRRVEGWGRSGRRCSSLHFEAVPLTTVNLVVIMALRNQSRRVVATERADVWQRSVIFWPVCSHVVSDVLGV